MQTHIYINAPPLAPCGTHTYTHTHTHILLDKRYHITKCIWLYVCVCVCVWCDLIVPYIIVLPYMIVALPNKMSKNLYIGRTRTHITANPHMHTRIYTCTYTEHTRNYINPNANTHTHTHIYTCTHTEHMRNNI